jgi:hypothetical protein
MLLKGINMQYLADILRTETLYLDAIDEYERILTIEPNNPWAISGKSNYFSLYDRRDIKKNLMMSYKISKYYHVVILFNIY